jgi:chemotaxis protein CheZ
MPVQRKVFRIEETSSTRPALRDVSTERAKSPEISAEYSSLRALIEPLDDIDRTSRERALAHIAEAQAFKRELELIYAAVDSSRSHAAVVGAGALGSDRIARTSRDLAAIVTTTEHSIHSILQAAEEIDQAAVALSAALKGTHDKGLSHDIQERVVQIFEACNFQDLTGQRVTQVLSTLKFLEEHTRRLLEIWRGIEAAPDVLAEQAADDRRLLNGPRLAGDSGHSSQHDIDALFAEPRRAS